MSSRKCYVCSCKSSSRWFKVSEELHEDVCACFNVKETVVLGDGSLCSSCRRNLSRWREKRPTNGKYFETPNSRGKPGLNKAPIARKKPKARTAHEEFVRNLPTFPVTGERFFGGCCLSGRFRYLKVETNMQPRKPNLHVKLSLESISET